MWQQQAEQQQQQTPLEDLRKSTPSTGAPSAGAPADDDGSTGLYGVSRKLASARVWLTKPDEGTPSAGSRGAYGDQYGGTPASPGEAMTVESVLASIYQWSPAIVQGIQAQLMQGGFYGKGERPTPGVVDAATFNAYKEAVIRAARSDRTLWDTLGMNGEFAFTANPNVLDPELPQQPAVPQFGTVERVLQRTDRLTLKGAAEQAFRAALGRKPTAAELSKFSRQFLAEEEKFQRTEFAAQDTAALADRDRAVQAQSQQYNQATGSGDASLDEFMSALSGQESGGTSDPVNVANKRTGAHGIFQIMPGNWAAWAKEAGLPSDAPKTAENQRLVARNKLAQYKRNYGSWEAVAVAWYAGPNAAKLYVKNPGADRFSRLVQGGSEPSINEYVSGVMSKMGAVSVAPSGAPASADTAERWAGGEQAVTTDAASGLPATNPVSTTREVVNPPSLSVSAQEAAEKADPAGFQAHNVTSVFDTFLKMLRSPV